MTAFVSRPLSRRSLSVSAPEKAWRRANPVTPHSVLPLNAMSIPFPGNSTTTSSPTSIPQGRFDRSASTGAAADQDCILEIDGQRYNLTKWAKAHPGGVKVLHKFHNKDASKAFHAADHSTAAYEMLKDFWIGPVDGTSIWHQLVQKPCRRHGQEVLDLVGSKSYSLGKIPLVFTNIWEYLCLHTSFFALASYILETRLQAMVHVLERDLTLDPLYA